MAAPVSRILNDATSQLDRLRGAPAPEAVAVDGRSLAQLLAFAAPYGALIHFYDLENTQNGDWSAFFAADPAIALALHAALDLPAIEEALLRLLGKIRGGQDRHKRLKRLKRVLAMIARLLGILDRTDPGRGEGEVQLQWFNPDSRQDGLADPLNRYHRHLAGGSIEDGVRRDHDGRESRWGDLLADILEDIVVTLIGELRRGTASALKALERSLNSGGHAPQAALYNAFAMLFVEARGVLNKFPRRLVDFYYGDVLEQHARAAQADEAFLTFTTAKNVDQVAIARDTVFLAGTDSQGAAINYAADAALEVTAATVTAISVHRVTKAPIDASSKELAPSGVLSGEVELSATAPVPVQSFPMFGTTTSGTFGSLTMKPASLGFVIISPTLMLTGGDRTVEISFSVISRNFAPIAAQLDTPAAIESFVEVIAQAIRKVFRLQYSTAGGWMKVDSFTVTPSIAATGDHATSFTLTFHLPPDAPPLVAVSTKPAADAPPPTLPASAYPDHLQQPTVIGSVKPKLLNPSNGTAWKAINEFALLTQLEVTRIDISVSVQGLTDLTLSTPNGPVDASQNFALFGLPPTQYAALEISTPELFAKTIDSLSISISWVGLPVTSTGFQGYYQNYVVNADGAIVTSPPLFDNMSFQVAFSVTNPGLWDIATGKNLYLFQTGTSGPSGTTPVPSASGATGAVPAPAVPVLQSSVLDAPAISSMAPPPYYNPTASALCLNLVAPSYAFGNILYSSNLMAASAAQSAAISASAKVSGGAPPSTAAAFLASLATTNASAPDKTYRQVLAPVVEQTISALTGEALTAVQQAIAQSGAPASVQAALQQSLDAALAAAGDDSTPTLWSRLTGSDSEGTDASAVLAALIGWLAANEAAIGTKPAAQLQQAHVLLLAASNIDTTFAASADLPPAVARPNMAATIRQAQLALAPPTLPNPPWLPTASAVTLSYTASTEFPLLVDLAPTVKLAQTPAPTAATDPHPTGFLLVTPFDKVKSPSSGAAAVGLIPHVDPDAALYIQLSVQVPQISLLFVLSAGPNGWWDKAPTICWEQYFRGQWTQIFPLDDSTNGLSNSGIVTLPLKTATHIKKPPRVRARAIGDTKNAPFVDAVIANALKASWIGPGGAAGLGLPKPAGTITKSQSSIAGLGSIAQPMQSFGGRPPSVGPAFQMWMAERLRHKNFGIDGWDYARLALDAVPSLWQAAVIPATDGKTGKPAPGKVWVVLVAGPTTPNIAHPTTPQVDLTTLSEVGEMLQACVSPFIEVAVTNPPYVKLQVTTELWFSDADTDAFWEEQLNDELIKWLSPWPDPSLGPRPANYYTKRAVAEFIRSRSYVRAIIKLTVEPIGKAPATGYCYLTSAGHHNVTSKPDTGQKDDPALRAMTPASGA